jgi:lysophospholipase L1-like esterase
MRVFGARAAWVAAMVLATCGMGRTDGEAGGQLAGMTIERILILGNSVTIHGVAEDIGWPNYCGMAASVPENDYVHRLAAKIAEATGAELRIDPTNPPSITAENEPVPGDANVVNVADIFERRYDTYTSDRLERQLAWEPNVVVLQFGENVPRDTFSGDAFKTGLETLMAGLKEHGDPLILVASQILGGGGELDEIKQQVCAEDPARRIYVDMSDFGADPTNVASSEPYFTGIIVGHPGDKGMAFIADHLFAALAAYAEAHAGDEG